MFEARIEGERHHCHETILGYVQKAPDDVRWEIDRNELNELLATKKESAPGPYGIPYSLYRCAGRLGSFLKEKAYQQKLAGGLVPSQFAASWTVLHSQIAGRRCIFQVETTALAHVACSPQEIGYFTDGLCHCIHQCQSLLNFARLRRRSCLSSFVGFLRKIYCNSTTQVRFAGRTRGQFTMARGVRQGCPASAFLFAMAFDPISRWLANTIIPRNPAAPDFLQPCSVRLC